MDNYVLPLISCDELGVLLCVHTVHPFPFPRASFFFHPAHGRVRVNKDIFFYYACYGDNAWFRGVSLRSRSVFLVGIFSPHPHLLVLEKREKYYFSSSFSVIHFFSDQ